MTQIVCIDNTSNICTMDEELFMEPFLLRGFTLSKDQRVIVALGRFDPSLDAEKIGRARRRIKEGFYDKPEVFDEARDKMIEREKFDLNDGC